MGIAQRLESPSACQRRSLIVTTHENRHQSPKDRPSLIDSVRSISRPQDLVFLPLITSQISNGFPSPLLCKAQRGSRLRRAAPAQGGPAPRTCRPHGQVPGPGRCPWRCRYPSHPPIPPNPITRPTSSLLADPARSPRTHTVSLVSSSTWAV